VRGLIEGGHIPDDVSHRGPHPGPRAPHPPHLRVAQGAKKAIVHVYNATCKSFRDNVFGMSKAEVVAMAVDAVKLIRRRSHAGTEITLEYSPELFTATELDFAREVCDAVTAAWGATPQRKVILNLPTTVEIATPNIYADQIEWMHRTSPAATASSSASTRTTTAAPAVAAAELGLMAGADRVEGCLFGNGERTGNVDLVTVALNMYTQGVHPGSISRTSTPSPAPSNTAPSSRSTRATRTWGISYSRPSPAPTRMPSRRGLPLKRRTSNGRCPTSRSTRPTSAAATTR
jgi:2-isopropylmalate synthase